MKRKRVAGAIEWSRVFSLRCRSKRGETLSAEDSALLHRAWKADAARYAAMNAAVFEATKPVGSP